MPAYYSTIQTQLKADILDVLGAGSVVCFGRPKRPITTYPHAIVRTRIPREFEGPRRVREIYMFDIVVKLPIVDAHDEGCEPYAMEQAELLLDRLAPHSIVGVPVAAHYAGIGSPSRAPLVEYVDSEDTDEWIGFHMQFETEATVAQ